MAQTQPLTPSGDPLPMPTPAECWALKAISQKRPIPSSLALRPAFKLVVEQIQGLSGDKQRNQALRSLRLRLTDEATEQIKAANIDAPPPVDAVPVERHKPDDDQIAQELAVNLRGKMAYFHNTWWEYVNGGYRKRQIQEIKQSIRLALREGDYRTRGVAITESRISSIEKLLQYDLLITDQHIEHMENRSMHYLNLQDGLLNLKTYQVEAHRPDLYLTAQCDFSMDDSVPDYWLKFLNSSLVKDDDKTDHEQINLLQELMGYSLTARTEKQASVWLIGKPASGKSTLIGIINNLMGSHAATIDLNQLASNRFLLAGLVGKRVVSFTEASSAVLPDAIYKALVGGQDRIYADVKNAPAIEFMPRFKVWWAMNTPPRVTDRSGAVFRRLRPLIFNRTIPESQQIPDLEAKLMAERPAILQWMLDGLKRLDRAGKFTEPATSKAWLEDFIYRQDTERNFIDEMCIRDEKQYLTSNELYRAYCYFCSENGYKAKSRSQFKEELQRLGLRESKYNTTVFWGVGKKDPKHHHWR